MRNNAHISNTFSNTSGKSEYLCGLSTRCGGKYVADLWSQYRPECRKSRLPAKVVYVSRRSKDARFGQGQEPCPNGSIETRFGADTGLNISNENLNTSNTFSNTWGFPTPASAWTFGGSPAPRGAR